MTHDERGSTTVEVVILVPALVLLVSCFVGGARVWSARAAVHEAAHAGARAASLERTPGAAVASGTHVARDTVASGVASCRDPVATVDATAFSTPPGVPATVRARVRCQVVLHDLFGLPVPGSLPVDADAAVPLDRYRGRR